VLQLAVETRGGVKERENWITWWVSFATTLSPTLKSLTCGPISTISPATSVPESDGEDGQKEW